MSGKNKTKGSSKSYSSEDEEPLLTDTSQDGKRKLNKVSFCTVIILLLRFPISLAIYPNLMLLIKLIWSQGKRLKKHLLLRNIKPAVSTSCFCCRKDFKEEMICTAGMNIKDNTESNLDKRKKPRCRTRRQKSRREDK